MKYSIIVPVYNRPDEVDELLESLSNQTQKDFEVIIVEDGSVKTCKDVCDKYADILVLYYYAKKNSGPGQRSPSASPWKPIPRKPLEDPTLHIPHSPQYKKLSVIR